MAGSLISIDPSSNNQAMAMAMNPILEQWQVQYARFVHFSPLSSATPHQPLLIPRSIISRKIRKGGVWFSTSASAAGTASLKLIAAGSDDAILHLSLRCKVLEEHRVSKLNFTWPQVSCVSGFPARGSRAIFVSYKDCLGQVQKFALRFLTIYEAEQFIDVLKEILYNPTDELQGSKHNSEPSSQSEFVSSVGLPYRAEEDWRHTTSADTSTTFRVPEEDWTHTTSADTSTTFRVPEEDWSYTTSADTSTTFRTKEDRRHTTTADTITRQEQAGLKYEVDKHSNAQEAMHNPEVEEFLCDFPPSFTSFLKNCCPAAEEMQASLAEEIDLKTQIARYLEDSSFQDMLIKVEKVIEELGDGVML